MSLSHVRMPAPTRSCSAGLALVRALFLLFFLVASQIETIAAGEPASPRVTQFSPQGTAKAIRQVTARFSDPMVPLGDPRPPVTPFEVACPEEGRARWVSSREWAYDFARDLPAGIRCAFRIRAGLTTLDGKPFAARQEFAFSTGGPAVKRSFPRQGAETIDEEQAFLLVLDAEPTEESVREHVWVTVEGIRDRIALRPVTPEARARILQSQRLQSATEPMLVLQAGQRFPNDVRVTLVWGKGVTSRSGVSTDQDQTLPFRVRKPFTAQFSCERENPRAGCTPVTPMQVEFSAPVSREQAGRVALIGPGDRRWSPEPEKTPQPLTQAVVFTGPFPESTSFRVDIPPGLVDDAGRRLANAARFPLTVRTEPFPPLARFAARFGIVERADPVLPVTFRNLEPEVRARLLRADQAPTPGALGTLRDWLDRVKGRVWRVPPERGQEIVPWLRRVAAAERERSVFDTAETARKEFAIPKPSGAKPFEVVGIPLEGPGLYIVELESATLGAALLGQPRPMYVPTAALVTNLSVHFKWGQDASLVWVTALDTGTPVHDARVAIQDCAGTLLWTGSTDANGMAQVHGLPKGWKETRRCKGASRWIPFDAAQTEALQGLDSGLFVLAQTHDDLSFAHSSWDRGLEAWRFRLPYADYRGPLAIHTILDRPLLRAGETVHMKHVLRKRTLGGISPVPEMERPTRLVVEHLGSDQKYDLPLRWDANGIAESAWPIPREAKLGTYQVVMEGVSSGSPRRWVSADFRVEEFRVALARGSIRLPAEPQVAVTDITADLGVGYLAGGGARDLPVTVRALIHPKEIPAIDEFEEFAFANGPVTASQTSQEAEDALEHPDSGQEPEAGEMSPEGAPARRRLHQRERVILDAAGTGRVVIARLPRVTTPRELLVEMEYLDPNGEVRTVASRAPLWPARRLAGIRPDSWMASRDSLKAWVAVVDVARSPVAGAPVRVDVFERIEYSHRKRLVGGFYAYEHVEEIRQLGSLCQGVTDGKGRFLCEGRPPAEGNLVLQVSATDPEGNASTAHSDVWVPGAADWWFRVQDSDRMDLLPEKRRHEPGERARLQVRMPFREATALVTVEREGVLDAFVTTLSGKEPVVEIPVKATYAPNVFVSVLALRGRVGGVQPTALVDLGKPAFKLGIAEIRVGWRAHELRVTVTPDRPVYRVREKARVKIAVRTADGQAPPRGSEVAVAAVDEGLLELAENKSWSLLEPMMRRRGYDVATATAQMQVVGKRHFGLKALPQGGGGGRQVTRELFETLLLWAGRVRLDARGEAVVEVPLNDTLGSFRIVAVATGGIGLFGTGSATIRSTQDLMLLAGIPPLVREGDRFPAEFTVRNTTQRPMDVTLSGRVDGLAAQPPARSLRLAPGEARTVGWDIAVPVGVQSLRYEVQAGEPGGAIDRARFTQQVRPATPVRVTQATLLQLAQPLRQPVERPADALSGRGGIQVIATSGLAGSLVSVQDRMRPYPYTCLEQQVSRLVTLRDEAGWTRLAAGLPAFLDTDGLLKYFPQMVQGSDVLTAYVLAVVHEAGWRFPPEIRARVESGLKGFVRGAVIRHSALPTTDLAIRKLAAVEALSRTGQAAPSLLDSIAIEPNLWPTSALLDWWNILHRLSGVPNRAARLRDAEQIVRSRLNVQGTTLGFSRERSDALWWLMVSPDVNAVRLILHLLESGQWRDELPRLVQGALARRHRGAWDLTTANAWGALAIEKFVRVFEASPVAGTTTAGLAGVVERIAWSATPQGRTLSLPWPAAGQELELRHEGAGSPWIVLQAQAAIPLRTPLSSGYAVTKTLTPVEQKTPGRWSRGDVVRVRLTVEAQSDMTWVAVNDPIPGGASHLGTGLGGDSAILSREERRTGCCFAHAERGFESFRAYYEYFPKGAGAIEYTIRLNQSGRFELPTTRVEALYAPEMFGELPNEALEVHP